MGHIAEKVIGVSGVKSISVAAEKLTGTNLPKWNKSIPSSANLRAECYAIEARRGTDLERRHE